MEIAERIDIKKRTAPKFDNEFHIYKARAYATCGEGDDRLQVRVLPYMLDIAEDELDNLPKYAPLIRGTCIQVDTEKESLTGTGTLLWVMALPDFTFGYVIGEANAYEGPGDSKLVDSWPFKEISDLLNKYDATTSNFEYKNIVVEIRNDSGTYMEFHNTKSGEKWMMTCQGDLIHMQPGKVIVQASAGVERGADRSNIVLEPKCITVNTASFIVNAKKILLGKHNHKLLGTIGMTPVSCDGMNLKPIENIYV